MNRMLLVALFLLGLSTSTQAQKGPQSDTVTEPTWLYSVRPGDTLWALCRKYTSIDRCWIKLGEINNVIYPRQLPPGFVVEFPLSWLKEPPVNAKVLSVTGSVSLVVDGQERGLSAGDALSIGQSIIANQGYASIQFGDGAIMVVEPGTVLHLDTLSSFDGQGVVDSRLRLVRGSIRTRVPEQEPKSKFRVSTPAAVAAVRGTEFRVSTAIEENKPSMRGEVFDGTVSIASEINNKDIEKGYGIKVAQGEPVSEPVRLLAAPIVEDQSFSRFPAAFQWSAVLGAARYQLDVLDDEESESLVAQHAVLSPEAMLQQLELGCYTARVRAVDADQLQGMPGRARLCITDTLDAPVLSAREFEDDDGRFYIKWSGDERAVAYRVQVSRTADFDKIQELLIETNKLEVPSGYLQGDYIRVIAIGESGEASDPSESSVLVHEDRNLILPILLGVLGLIVFL